MSENDRLTLIEASEVTGYSVGHLRRLVKAGRLTAWRRGQRLIVVDAAELDAMFEQIK